MATFTKCEPCTCGSGGHPRECEAHPFAFQVHCAELSLPQTKEDIEELTPRDVQELWRTYQRALEAEWNWIAKKACGGTGIPCSNLPEHLKNL